MASRRVATAGPCQTKQSSKTNQKEAIYSLRLTDMKAGQINCCKNMNRLISLDLSRNRLSELMPEISEMENLRFLTLNDNLIKKIRK
jgi:Leucine-rich repeat (LRR) protein